MIPEPKRVFAPAVRQSLQQCSRAAAAAAFALGAVWSAEAQTISDQFDGIWPLSITPVHQFDADFDRGGSSSEPLGRERDGGTRVRFARHRVPLRYEHEKWPSNCGVWRHGAVDQSADLESGWISTTRRTRWGFSVSPSVQWSAETGAAWSKARPMGQVRGGSSLRSHAWPGSGRLQEIRKQSLPFLIVDWDITERWSLKTYSSWTGASWTELSTDLGNRWEVIGGAYCSYRYCLDDSGLRRCRSSRRYSGLPAPVARLRAACST